MQQQPTLYLTDDQGHCIYKCTPEGERLGTFGSPGEPSDTGVVDANYRTLQQPSGPFNLPTNLTFSSDGEMFVEHTVSYLDNGVRKVMQVLAIDPIDAIDTVHELLTNQ